MADPTTKMSGARTVLSTRPPADGQEQLPRTMTDHVPNDYSNAKGSLGIEPTPSCFKWAQNLHNLLEDIEGIELFMQYLKQEGHNTRSLDFWFACEGIRKKDSEGPLHHTELSLIRLINKQYVRGLSDISVETKSEIAKKISSKLGIDRNIFNLAQKEVESVIMKTTYPNFLRSDIYVQHVQSVQNKSPQLMDESSADTTAKDDNDARTSSPSAVPEVINSLATVYEDSELSITPCNKVMLTRQSLQQRSRYSTDLLGRCRPEAQAGLYLKATTPGYDSYYTKYSAYLLPSAQDSELQSLSSDALTDDNISLAGSSSSIECGPVYRRCPRNDHNRHHRASKYGNLINKDHLTHSQFIPRTQRMPNVTNLTPNELANLLIPKLNKLKEEQKTKERLAERLQDFQDGKGSGFNDRACLDRDFNRESAARVQPCFPKASIAPNCKTSSNGGSAATPLFAIGPGRPQMADTAQSILDEHVSRVWEDSAHQTPSPSPGCLTPLDAQNQPDNSARQRVPPCGASNKHNSMYMYQYSHYKVHHNTMYPLPQDTGRHRRDHDSYSTDSGNFNDFASDIKLLHSAALFNQQNPMSFNTPSHPPEFNAEVPYDYSSSSHQGKEYSKWAANGAKKPPSDASSSCVDSGISVIDLSSSSSLAQSKRSGYRKSYPESVANPLPANEMTVVAYSFGRGSVPYLSKIPGKHVTLKQLKYLISKKGNFRYFFKKVSEDFGVVFEEVTDDNELLPLFEGKIFSVLESVE